MTRVVPGSALSVEEHGDRTRARASVPAGSSALVSWRAQALRDYVLSRAIYRGVASPDSVRWQADFTVDVLTDAPFAATPARQFGIDDFCSRCRVCENACPPEAIGPTKQTVRGVEKWYVDFDRCIPFFAESSGCAICIAVCPWSRPGVGFNIADKLARRARIIAEREAADAGEPGS